MKHNSKNQNKYNAHVETNKIVKRKIRFYSNNNLLKVNQIPLAGKHSILSALNNKRRKLHYLITTNENFSKWAVEISKLRLLIN